MSKIFLFDALREATDEEMQKDSSVFVLGEDVGHYGGSYKVTKDLHIKYGDIRILDTPIAENSFMGMAIGSAITGLRPIVEGMNMSFLLLAFNQISNNAGMLRYTSGGNFKIPLVIRGPGGVGRQLGAEHSQRLEAYFQAIPGLKIVACSTPYNAKGLLKSAIRDDNPVILFEHVLLYNLKDDIPDADYYLPLDKAELVRSGTDVTIVTYSRMRHHVMQAVDVLIKDGVNPEVIDLISLKPIDIKSIVSSLAKTNYLVIVEECMKTGGIAAEIIAQVNDNYFDLLDSHVVRLSSLDVPTPYNGNLEKATIISPEQIVNSVRILLS
uniref:Pyruvate dehydrogenase E1 component subunit beta n=1 Tax=Chondria sp. (in: red algae) TaxID=1982705 RepID=A0A1Z1MQF2_9FLOR|nr:pyruvate dehydrogenase E1 component beta subunit [Chondria sp. (in: red algae)]